MTTKIFEIDGLPNFLRFGALSNMSFKDLFLSIQKHMNTSKSL